MPGIIHGDCYAMLSACSYAASLTPNGHRSGTPAMDALRYDAMAFTVAED